MLNHPKLNRQNKLFSNRILAGTSARVDPATPTGRSWETYDQIFPNIALIRARVAAGTMPPPRFMVRTPEQKDLLLAWIDTGASETVNEEIQIQ